MRRRRGCSLARRSWCRYPSPRSCCRSRRSPAAQVARPLSLRALFRGSPLGTVGIFAAGRVYATLTGMGSVYGTQVGMNAARVSLLIATLFIGALFLQYPIGLVVGPYRPAQGDLRRRGGRRGVQRAGLVERRHPRPRFWSRLSWPAGSRRRSTRCFWPTPTTTCRPRTWPQDRAAGIHLRARGDLRTAGRRFCDGLRGPNAFWLSVAAPSRSSRSMRFTG